MGKLKNFFFEKEEDTMEMNYEKTCAEECMDISTDDVCPETLINDIYTENNLGDASKSIFKVAELKNALPKEMPDATKKTTVLSILQSFGLTADEVIEDGNERIRLIDLVCDGIKNDNELVISDNNSQIEQKKIEIQELEKDNAERLAIMTDAEEKIENEIKKILDLIAFVK